MSANGRDEFSVAVAPVPAADLRVEIGFASLEASDRAQSDADVRTTGDEVENMEHHNRQSQASAGATATVDTGTGESEEVMAALRSHVPITLLMDLGSERGPDSAAISEAEGGEADWLLEPPGNAG